MFIHSGVEVEGTVVYFQRVQDSRTRWYLAPMVSFVQVDGNPFVFVSMETTTAGQFKVGAKIRVTYLPGHPEGARIIAFRQLFLSPIDAAILGGILTLVSK